MCFKMWLRFPIGATERKRLSIDKAMNNQGPLTKTASFPEDRVITSHGEIYPETKVTLKVPGIHT